MREIKFRAWDKAKGKFTDFDNVGGYLLLAHDGKPTYFCQTPDAIIHPPYVGELIDLIKINLFTGLKDRNGKEIYGGDVLQVRFFEYGPYEVVFIDACFELYGKDGNYACDLKQVYSVSEVISNIYENPELLELGPPHD